MKKHSMKGCWMFKQIKWERQTVKKFKERDKQWKWDSKALFLCLKKLLFADVEYWLIINKYKCRGVRKEQTWLPILFFVSCVHNNLSGLRRQGLQQMGAHLGGSSGIGSTWHEVADPSISEPLGPGGYHKEQWDTRRVPGDRQTAIFILRSRLPQKGWRRAASWWTVLGSGWCGTSRET